jgi:putative ABC transport system permease protein
VKLSVLPDDASQLPITATAMRLRFLQHVRYSVSVWRRLVRSDDETSGAVVVISHELNDQLFHGANSVGREINLSMHNYRIVGVMDSWDPKPLFYDLFDGNGGFAEPVQLFIPFSRAIDLQIDTAGNNNCGPRTTALARCFSAANALDIYWADCRARRMPMPIASSYVTMPPSSNGQAVFLGSERAPARCTKWLDYEHAVPPESRISLMVSLGFLVICLVNTIGLLLAKFMRRAPDIGVRRALGAPRRTDLCAVPDRGGDGGSGRRCCWACC